MNVRLCDPVKTKQASSLFSREMELISSRHRSPDRPERALSDVASIEGPTCVHYFAGKIKIRPVGEKGCGREERPFETYFAEGQEREEGIKREKREESSVE
jgi:hypothetical protein